MTESSVPQPNPLDTSGKLVLTTQQIASERAAVLGVSGSGKSNTIAVLLEQMLPDMPFAIIDLHSEYHGLRSKYEIPIFGRSPHVDVEIAPDKAARLAEYSFANRTSLILDLLHVGDEDERLEYVYNFLNRLWELALIAEVRRPYGVIIEEAHNFIPEGRVTSPTLKKLKTIALEGRKFGLNMIFASQRAAEVSKTVLGMCKLVFLHAAYIYADFQQYQRMLPYSLDETKKIVLGLDTGQAIVRFGKESGVYQIRRRETFDAGGTPLLEGGEQPPLLTIDAGFLDTMRDLFAQESVVGQEHPCQDGDVLRLEIDRLHQTVERLEKELDDARALPLRVIEQTEPEVKPDVDGYRSPLQTSRGVAKQERAFKGLLEDICRSTMTQQRMLYWLTEREGQSFTVKEMARYLGVATRTITDRPPTLMMQRGVIGRTGRGTNMRYFSTATKHIEREYPDLQSGELVVRLLRSLPRLR